MERWASFSTAGLRRAALVFWRHVQGRLRDLTKSWASKWHWWILGTWSVVTKCYQDTQRNIWLRITLKEKGWFFIVVQYFVMHAGDSSSHHTLPCRVQTWSHTQITVRKVTVTAHFMYLFFVSLFVLPFFYLFIIFHQWQMCLCCWVIRVNSYLDLVGCSLVVRMLPLWKRHPRIPNHHSNHHSLYPYHLFVEVWHLCFQLEVYGCGLAQQASEVSLCWTWW